MNTHPEHFAGSTSEPSTLIALLRLRACSEPSRRAYTFVSDDEAEGQELTYAELDRRARAVGALLQREGARGRRVLLLYPPGLDYVCALFGCLYAGSVPVPAYPPRPNKSLHRLQAIVADAAAELALTTTQIKARAVSRFGDAPGLGRLRWLTWEGGADELADEWREPTVDDGELALLQYTSGSTGEPKGVMLSHRNLLHNSRLLARAFGYTPESHCVSWLPPYHDMGLIGGILQPLHGGFACTLMPPAFFLQRPLRWLQAISRYRGTISGAPNFAYDLCVRKSSPEERARLDLSCWSVAFNGSEPVRSQTLERFAAAFEPCGFSGTSFFPCYGLAEATLLVSGSKRAAGPAVRKVRPDALARNSVEEAEGGESLSLVGCGEAPPGQQVVVVDCETMTAAPPGRVGEIWVAGPSVARGYWKKPDETEQTFGARLAGAVEGPFLRTGDLGFMDGGQVFVTGRLKDLVIVRGLNHYPQDIELTAESAHPSLRPGCGAAFSAELDGEERLVVAQEVTARAPKDLSSVVESVRRAVAEEHGIDAHAVLLLRPGSIPKTSSGKVRRRACKEAFSQGGLEVVWEWRRAASSADEAPALPLDTAADVAADVEARLVSQLAARLGLDPSEIDVNRPLTSYGVDSLTAVELSYQLEGGPGAAASAVDLLEGASIREAARSILAQSEAWEDTLPARAYEETEEAPLSYGQQALWFLHQLAPHSPAYNIVRAVRLRDDTDTAALRRAFQALLERHPALRTTFHAAPGGPRQRTHALGELHFRHADATTWDAARMNRSLVEEAHRPFDLERGPLMRVNLYTLPSREHVLLLTMHHIVSDFWSLAVLARELGVLYRVELSGHAAQLAPPPLRYTDHVSRQAELLDGPRGDELWKYWRRQLAGSLPVLNLPASGPRPPVQTFRGATHSFRLGQALTEDLKSLCRDSRATLYVGLLAAFQVLLCRYGRQEEVVVGCPSAGRGRAELANVVGYFVNTLPLRADLTADPTFKEFLAQVRASVLVAFAHQDFPLTLLVERLRPPRDPSRSPLFQATFVLQKTHLSGDTGLDSLALGRGGARASLGGLEVEAFGLDQQIAQFDLSLAAAEVGDELAVSVEYNTDLFDAAFINQFAAHFETLLAGAVADPARRVFDLPLMTDDEERQVLSRSAGPRQEYPEHACLHQLFEQQAERTPDAVAVVYEGERLAYGELNARANRLARHLRAAGVGPDVPVGICVERSPAMLVGLLAVLKAGGAYVPLDPEYPAERLAYILSDARPPVVLTEERFLPLLPASDAVVLCLDRDRASFAAHAEENLPPAAAPDNLAYVIYTSGSTGKPKGAMLAHRGVVNCLAWMQRSYALSPADRFLHRSSLGFDPSVWELFWPLAAGGAVVLAPPGAGHDAAALLRLIAEQKVTLAYFVPSMLGLVLMEKDVEELGGSLRAVICGGESLSAETMERFHSRLARAELHHSYGPTECSIASAEWLCRRGEARRIVPIGESLANTRNYVLDPRMRPVPASVPGELHIGGLCVGRGYLGRPSLTAERFVPDPLSAEPGARLYRTGDLVRHLPGGVIEFMGRLDHQLKVRGLRIEAGEIEAALEGHERVREAAVLARGEGPDAKRLVAYVVTAGGPAPTAEELRGHLRRTLPDYMVPAAFVFLDAFPLTPGGKVDRMALPEPEARVRAASDEEMTLAEEIVSEAWGEVLGLEGIGPEENFFELGGHSLLAIQAVSRLRERLDLDIPVRTLFVNPTVRDMASAVDRLLGEQISQIPDDEAQRLLQEER